MTRPSNAPGPLAASAHGADTAPDLGATTPLTHAANDAPRPWTRLGDGPTHAHRILSVRDVHVADPRTGRAWERVVIDCPDWVNVVATTPEGALVLVQQFRFGTWTNTIEIPGGMIDAGEDPAAAAARELEEETGFRPGRVTLLGVSHPNPAIQGNRLFSFRAEQCVRVHGGAPDAGEDLRVLVAPRADVLAAVRAGAITHSLVLAALFYDGL